MEVKFYRCAHCGNIITYIKASGVKVICCGEEMKQIIANTTDGAYEKHVPAVQVEGNKVTVNIGSVDHPMIEAHFIEWICLQTKLGFQVKKLKPGDKPHTCFTICDNDKVEMVYEYCNLHGLWKFEE